MKKQNIKSERTTAGHIRARFKNLNEHQAEILERAEVDGYGVVATIAYTHFGNYLLDVSCDDNYSTLRGCVRIVCKNALVKIRN